MMKKIFKKLMIIVFIMMSWLVMNIFLHNCTNRSPYQARNFDKTSMIAQERMTYLMVGLYALEIGDLEQACNQFDKLLKNKTSEKLNIKPDALSKIFTAYFLHLGAEKALKKIAHYNVEYAVSGVIIPALVAIHDNQFDLAIKILKMPVQNDPIFFKNSTINTSLINHMLKWVEAGKNDCTEIKHKLSQIQNIEERKSSEEILTLNEILLASYCELPEAMRHADKLYVTLRDEQEVEYLANKYSLRSISAIAKFTNNQKLYEEAQKIQTKMNNVTNIAQYNENEVWFLKNLQKIDFPKKIIAENFNILAHSILLELRDDIVAEIILKMSLTLTPNDDAYIMLGEIYIGRQENKKAHEMLHKVTDTERHIETILLESYIDKKSIDDKINSLKIFIKLHAKNDVLKLRLAELYMISHKYGEAIKIYDDLIKLKPENASLYFYRAVAYDTADNWSSAQKDLEHALKIDPNSAEILNYLGFSLLTRQNEKNLIEAENYLMKAYEISPNSAAIIDSVGWLYFQKGEYRQANIYLDKALAQFPSDSEINEHYGDLMYCRNNHNSAETFWHRAIKNSTDEKIIKRLHDKIKYYEKNINICIE